MRNRRVVFATLVVVGLAAGRLFGEVMALKGDDPDFWIDKAVILGRVTQISDREDGGTQLQIAPSVVEFASLPLPAAQDLKVFGYFGAESAIRATVKAGDTVLVCFGTSADGLQIIRDGVPFMPRGSAVFVAASEHDKRIDEIVTTMRGEYHEALAIRQPAPPSKPR